MNDVKKVLLFTGAGVGVPLGLPTSTQFHGIDDAAKPITNHVRTYLGSGAADDIEWILSALESFRSQTDLTEFLLPHLTPSTLNERQKQLIRGNLDKLKNQAVAELVRLKRLIFDQLNAYEPEKAAALHIGMLQEIRGAYERCAISVMTTNYDLTFETALENSHAGLEELGIEDVDFGFVTRLGRPVYDPTANANWSTKSLEFLKVHGSLDWHRDANGQCGRAMSRTVPADPDQMAILYPGFKGVPEAEPFVSLHGRLNRRLVEADLVIVVGFAFRDSYINAIFDNVLRMRPDLRVLYFNPLPLDHHPHESAAPRLCGAHSKFRHVESGVQLGATPLMLKDVVQTVAKERRLT